MVEKAIKWERWRNPIEHVLHLRGVTDDEGGSGDTKTDNTFDDPSLLLFTRFGAVPIKPDELPPSEFDFWVGHCNFSIDSKIAEAIRGEPGVESLDVVSPYRFRMAVARQFQALAVQKGVEVAVRGSAGRSEDRSANNIAALLKTRFPHWAIVFRPGQRMAVITGPNVRQVRLGLESLGELPRGSRVIVSSSELVDD